MLKLKYLTKTDIPEDYRSLYEETDDGWVLKLEDKVVPKSKLDEFRQNNIQLMKQLKMFEGVDPEEYRKFKEKKLIEAGKIEELLQQRVAEVQSSYEENIKSLKQKLARTVIDSEVQKAVLSVAKPKQGAIADILLRARTTWTLDDDGNPVPVNGQNGEGPSTIQQWAEQLVNEAPHLFEDSNGGGAQGGSGSSGGTKAISRNDKDAFAQNLEDIAKGKVTVLMD